MQVSCKVVAHGSTEYWQAVKLRSEILREPLGLAFSADELKAEGDSTHIVAFSDKKIIGCLTMKPLTSDTRAIKMRQVAVDSNLQGKNIGKTLVWFAEQWASAQGYSHIVLHVRQVAAGFYKRLGYTIEAKIFEEVGLLHHKAVKYL